MSPREETSPSPASGGRGGSRRTQNSIAGGPSRPFPLAGRRGGPEGGPGSHTVRDRRLLSPPGRLLAAPPPTPDAHAQSLGLPPSCGFYSCPKFRPSLVTGRSIRTGRLGKKIRRPERGRVREQNTGPCPTGGPRDSDGEPGPSRSWGSGRLGQPTVRYARPAKLGLWEPLSLQGLQPLPGRELNACHQTPTRLLNGLYNSCSPDRHF